jgi:hypothetical protein
VGTPANVGISVITGVGDGSTTVTNGGSGETGGQVGAAVLVGSCVAGVPCGRAVPTTGVPVAGHTQPASINITTTAQIFLQAFIFSFFGSLAS